jgi:hypothetical protein
LGTVPKEKQMDREELLAHLRVLATRTEGSADREVVHASVVLHTLVASVMIETTPLLSQQAAEFSRLMIAVHSNRG